MMEYELIRSDRKTIALEVTRDGRVVVRAPRRLPQKQIDRFVAQHSQWLDNARSRQKARMDAHPEPDDAEIHRLKTLAKELLPKKVAAFSKIMGLSPAGITITGARTRFGSCSPKNQLCFSWRLMQYPEEAIEYVVVHELAHMVHRNHGPEFHALVAQILPDHKQRRALLKE